MVRRRFRHATGIPLRHPLTAVPRSSSRGRLRGPRVTSAPPRTRPTPFYQRSPHGTPSVPARVSPHVIEPPSPGNGRVRHPFTISHRMGSTSGRDVRNPLCAPWFLPPSRGDTARHPFTSARRIPSPGTGRGRVMCLPSFVWRPGWDRPRHPFTMSRTMMRRDGRISPLNSQDSGILTFITWPVPLLRHPFTASRPMEGRRHGSLAFRHIHHHGPLGGTPPDTLLPALAQSFHGTGVTTIVCRI